MKLSIDVEEKVETTFTNLKSVRNVVIQTSIIDYPTIVSIRKSVIFYIMILCCIICVGCALFFINNDYIQIISIIFVLITFILHLSQTNKIKILEVLSIFQVLYTIFMTICYLILLGLTNMNAKYSYSRIAFNVTVFLLMTFFIISLDASNLNTKLSQFLIGLYLANLIKLFITRVVGNVLIYEFSICIGHICLHSTTLYSTIEINMMIFALKTFLSSLLWPRRCFFVTNSVDRITFVEGDV